MIFLDPRDNRPIYKQIISSIEKMILSGVMEPGKQLPSIRNLAMSLSLNPNTVKRAYDDLETREVIYSIHGKGFFVNDKLKLAPLISRRDKEIRTKLTELIKDAQTIGISKKDFLQICEELFTKVGEKRD